MEREKIEAVIRQHVLQELQRLVSNHNEAVRVMREARNLSLEDLQAIQEIGRA